MGSKGRIPPPHMRRPLPGPGLIHPEPLGPGIRPPLAPFSPFDLLPPPEVLEQKLAAQHADMQRLATENQRLATTHGTLRQELAAAQHELQILNAQIGAIKAEREQQMRNLMDKIAKMETDLQGAEPLKAELQKARTEAQNLVVSRQELISKRQQLSQDLQRAHVDVQQIPALMSELEGLRQEYQHCRSTYDYERKLYNDHLESLQVMEKNYMSMAREVEKLRAELGNTTNVDRRNGPYGGTPGNNENDVSGLPGGQNAYEDGYVAALGRGPLPAASGGVATAASVASAPPYVGAQPVSAPAWTGYDAPRGPGYDASAMPSYDPQRGAYDPQRLAGYDVQRTGYDPQRGAAYDASRAVGYDAQSRGGAAPPLGHAAVPVNNMPYGSATPPARGAAGGYEAPPRGGNPSRR
ncbi:protein FLX-like 2 [Neltuma alba]|uniref:protein FLX-like 2 n=1 Tax=Neltuma alba TaxID=207710 RepID=UPI0010A57E6A|nr:protein FLX-like 2 [Prosopis alba]